MTGCPLPAVQRPIEGSPGHFLQEPVLASPGKVASIEEEESGDGYTGGWS